MASVRGVKHNPYAIPAKDLKMIVRPTGCGDERAVVLGTAAEYTTIPLCYVGVVEHRHGKSIATVRPRLATVFAHVHAAFIGIIDTPRRRDRHQQGMMISVGIIRITARRVPARHLLPQRSPVCGQ